MSFLRSGGVKDPDVRKKVDYGKYGKRENYTIRKK